MSFETWLSVVSGIVGIASFVFAVWVWLRADTRVKEITAAMQALHDIADSALWESQMLPSDSSESSRLAQLERSIGLVSAIKTVSGKYVGDHQSYRATELGALIHRGIIWSNAMIGSLEKSSDVRTVWLVSPDLEPDMSEAKTGDIVRQNLSAGKNYVYFYPKSLKFVDDKIRRVRRNVGADDQKFSDKVLFAPIEDWTISRLIPPRGNIILFFKDDWAYGTTVVLQEIVLSKVSRRGLFWQECAQEDAALVFEKLRAELPVI